MLEDKLTNITGELTRSDTQVRELTEKLHQGENEMQQSRNTLESENHRADRALDGLVRVSHTEAQRLDTEAAQAQKALQALRTFLIAELSQLGKEIDHATQMAHTLSVYVTQQDALYAQMGATLDTDVTNLEKQTDALKTDIVTHLHDTGNVLQATVDVKLEEIRTRLHARAGELTLFVEKDCAAAFARIVSSLGSNIDQEGRLVGEALATKESEIGAGSDRAHQLLSQISGGQINDLMESVSALSHSLEVVQSKIQVEAQAAAALQHSATNALSVALLTINTVLGLIHDLEHLFSETLGRHA